MPMPKLFKFPDPADYPGKHPAVLCPGERVLALYNQTNAPQAERISKKVRSWFVESAHTKGWRGVAFLPEVQTLHSAGAVLWHGLKQHFEPTTDMLVLPDGADSSDEE